MELGLAVAEALAAEGVHLGLCARDQRWLVDEANRVHPKHGVRIRGISADLSQDKDIARDHAEQGVSRFISTQISAWRGSSDA